MSPRLSSLPKMASRLVSNALHGLVRNSNEKILPLIVESVFIVSDSQYRLNQYDQKQGLTVVTRKTDRHTVKFHRVGQTLITELYEYHSSLLIVFHLL